MKKPCLTDARYLLLAALLTGCDFSGNDQPQVADSPATNNTTTSTLEAPVEIIDLSISPAMLETLQQQEIDFLAPAETPSTSFIGSSKKNDVSFSGKLHLDEDEDKEYLEAIDGGEISIEIKFE